MSLAEKLELLVTLDPSQGIAGLEKMSAAAQTHGKSVEDSLGRVGAAAMKMGVAGLAAGTFLTQLGDKEQASAQQLDAAISAAGQSVSDYSGRIEEAVKSGENFGHQAVDTNNALNTLVGSFGDTGKALDQMQLVEDLAAKKHIDLADAAQIVAKAHGGAGRIFKEFNIQVDSNTANTGRYDQALGELSQKLSGQASASMAGFSGWLSKTTAQVEDAAASFGQKYGPAIMAGSAALTAFGTISSGVSAILGKLALSRAADAAAAEAEAAADTEVAAASKLSTLGMLGVAGGVAAVAVAAYEGYQNSQKLTYSINNISDAATKLQGTQLDSYVSKVQQVMDFGGKSAHDFGVELASSSVPAANQFADAMDRQGKSSVEFRKGIADAAAMQEHQKEVTDESTAATDTNAESEKKAAAATKAHDDAIKSLTDTLHASIDPLFAMETAVRNNQKAQEDANKAQKDGKTTAEEKAAADQQVAETALAVHDASIKLADAMQSGRVSIAGAQSQLNEWVGQGLLTQQQADNVAWSLGVVAGKADELDGRNIDVHLNLTASVSETALKMLHGDIPGYADGGMVPGPRGRPQLAIVHGGEFVATTSEVDAAKRGGGMSAPTGAGSSSGQPIVVQLVLRDRVLDEVVIDAAARNARRNGNALASSISR